ncbi:MAG: M28 family peptidase, partial [Bacteroidales bacterium]|nr:M28 family peptidase [Bacteroidales bacterium]
MKKFYLSAALLISGLFSFSQDYDQMVDSLINQVELDSLVNYVRILTGEDSVVVNGTTVLIENRIYNSNDLAADYIKQTLEGYDLTTYDQVYATNRRNVYAIQEGTEYPDQYYLICAHYDAVTAYCADDNASGTAGVLEAARIFSNYDFQYSIIYALWDEEEIGLVGSGYYAQQAASNGDDILSVINMDMIAWDSNNDFLCEIHVQNYANSLDLANYMVSMNNVYQLGLSPVIQNPGTGASDHASFWYNGYSAVLLIEGYYSGDFNPYYHSV